MSDGSALYDIPLKTIDDRPTTLREYAGRVLLIVNVASKCGFTPQYGGLQRLYEKYREQGLVVLGFPSNDFLFQEPAKNSEIQQFCSLNFGVTFPLFAKVHVIGPHRHQLFRYLTDKRKHPEFGSWIKWNFTKFLVDRDGRVAARFGPKTEPEAPEVAEAIERLLIQTKAQS